MNEKISDFKANNEIDMERIINEYSNYLSVVIKNICGNFLSNEDIEEVLLDVFLALWKNRKKSTKKRETIAAHNKKSAQWSGFFS